MKHQDEENYVDRVRERKNENKIIKKKEEKDEEEEEEKDYRHEGES